MVSINYVVISQGLASTGVVEWLVFVGQSFFDLAHIAFSVYADFGKKNWTS